MSVPELELSVLAMDAYNRGYGAGRPIVGKSINDRGSVGETVGGYEIIDESDVTAIGVDVLNGFYAAAYKDGNNIVISYRGSDDIADAWNDWQFVSSAAGVNSSALPRQAILASQFYNTVKAANPDAEITLTGHSLGGGLAGKIPQTS